MINPFDADATVESKSDPSRKGSNMKPDMEIRRRSLEHRLRRRAFMKRNGIYIAAALCLALLGGVSLLLIKSPEEHSESPAEHSLDERMDQTARQFDTTLPTSSPSYPA